MGGVGWGGPVVLGGFGWEGLGWVGCFKREKVSQFLSGKAAR